MISRAAGSRPASAARARSEAIRAGSSAGSLADNGSHPSAWRITRSEGCNVARRIGGCGRWTGFGHDQMASKLTHFPEKAASSCVQMARMASRCSTARLHRVSNSTPWFSISSRFHPAPTPSMNRPPEIRSRVAICLASVMGSWLATSAMPVPSRIDEVTAAAAVSTRNGSKSCL